MSTTSIPGSSIQSPRTLPESSIEESNGKDIPFFEKDIKPMLSTSHVFDKIRPLVCSINSSVGESSGFFINHQGTALTVAHNIPMENVDGRIQFATDCVQINYGLQETPHFSKPSEGVIPKNAKALDLYSMESEIQLSESDVIPMLPEDIPLREGVKVYFAGYPLGQDVITFHKGTISSITDEEGIRHFTIDGTVVPGNSGGPVVIQHEGELYLVGVITSEVADFSPEDRKTIAIMEALKKHRKSNPNSGQFIQAGGSSIGAGGLTTSIQIQTPQGSETIKLNDRETILLAFDLIQRNLSTGIGKAIDVRHYQHLFQEDVEVEELDRYSVPVGKGKGLISNTVDCEIDGEKRTFARYIEVRYGNKGKGNRGIRLTLNPVLGGSTLNYKFTPNPHNSQGNYNKNQRDLYGQAALAIINQILATGVAPNSIDFRACKSTYTATLEE